MRIIGGLSASAAALLFAISDITEPDSIVRCSVACTIGKRHVACISIILWLCLASTLLSTVTGSLLNSGLWAYVFSGYSAEPGGWNSMAVGTLLGAGVLSAGAFAYHAYNTYPLVKPGTTLS